MDLEQNVYRIDTAITARNQAAAANTAQQIRRNPQQAAAQAQRLPASEPVAESRFRELIKWATK